MTWKKRKQHHTEVCSESLRAFLNTDISSVDMMCDGKRPTRFVAPNSL